MGCASELASLAEGRYRIQRLVGELGHKRTFLARDVHRQRDVTLAVVDTGALDEAARTRVREEALALTHLGPHPHVVDVYDAGEEDGRLYVVMQYMGDSVEDRLRRSESSRLPLDEALRIAGQVCQALEHTHRRGLVHRDLRPGTVRLTPDGNAKLGDFGLVPSLDQEHLTAEGAPLGAVAYMPPELALGQTPEVRSDLYALGAMLYEMVTGRPPFVGDDPLAIISQHLNSTPVPPYWHNSGTPPALQRLILGLLAKAPEARPPGAAAVREALAEITSAVAVVPEGMQPATLNPLEGLAAGVFVGREQAMKDLRAALDEAIGGRPRLVMLAGEPGIGKTRLAEELTTYARVRKAQVLWGRCHEGEGAPAYWPWVQIIRTYDPTHWVASMGAGAASIAQVVPEVRARLPSLPEPPALEPEQARFRLFDAIASFFTSAAMRHPLVLVLDDLHAADKPSLLLLQFLTRQLRDARLIVVGTYRDTELGRHHALAQALGDLVRESSTERILLRGLTQQDVDRFIAMTTGVEPPEALVRTVHEETEGNPFFMSEVVRLLASDARLERAEGIKSWSLTIPQGVREVIGRRLDRLSPDCNEVLTVAAVIGREFAVDALERVSEREAARTLELLEEAVAARVIGELPDTPRHFAFSHALVRETLYKELTPARRMALHRRVGEGLEALHGARPEPYLAELAHHFFESAHGAGGVAKAVDYTRRAGDRARKLLAYEDAAAHYERALQALDLEGPGDASRRGELLLALGEAQHGAGDREQAKATFRRAAELGRQSAAPELLARAALGYGRSGLVAIELGTFDEPLVGLLEEALAALDETDSALRARVLGNLAMALYWSPSRERRATLSREAVDIARRVGDPETLAAALVSMHFALWGADSGDEQLVTAREIVRLGERVGDVEMALQGRVWAISTLLALGDMGAANTEIAVYTRRAEELRQPRYLAFAAQWRIMRALLTGALDVAEELIQRGLANVQALVDQAVMQSLGIQTFILYRETGRLPELEGAITGYLEQYPAIQGWRYALANLYSHTGRNAEAGREFELAAAKDFRDLPEDLTWLVTVILLSETCALLGDARHAARLYELLLPYARHYVVLSAAVCLGSASRYLGQLATTMSRWEDAERHFEDAIAMNARIGAHPWLAHCQYDEAAMLVRQRDPGRSQKALTLLSQARDVAEKLGMKALAEQVATLHPGSLDVSPGASSVAIDDHAFRREGEYWTMVFEGTLVRVKEAKGFLYIARLLRDPGQQFHCRDLAAQEGDVAPAGAVAVPGSSDAALASSLGEAGPVLDAKAKADYRRRVADLQEELEEALRFNDPGRAARAEAEIDFVAAQLKAAVGLGGRDRKVGSHAERARLMVTQAIKAALKKIGRSHPSLAEHLGATIKTGYQCVYQPDPARPVSWKL